jgi:hypothetical protein
MLPGMPHGRATKSALDRIPGWFWPQDVELFRWLLTEQSRTEVRGDVAELGVYLGKSAVLLGDYLRADETFTVIDLFESSAGDEANAQETDAQYAGLSQAAFEANYLAVHPALPVVVRGFSQDIGAHVAPGTCRFVHVDASHLYAHVRGDVAAARQLVGPDAVVVFDDIRSAHTPGVAAAVWQEVTTGDLHPIIVSDVKLYATWSDPTALIERLVPWLDATGQSWEQQEIAGRPLLRVYTTSRVEAVLDLARSTVARARGLRLRPAG